MARPLEMSASEYQRLLQQQRERRGIVPVPTDKRQQGVDRWRAGVRFEQKLERACELYREQSRAYIERFEGKRVMTRHGPRTFGRGRPDWIGAAAGFGVLFDSKSWTEASFHYDLDEKGQREQLESLRRFLRVGRAPGGAQRTRAFLLLHDESLRVSPDADEKGCLWLLEGEDRLDALAAGHSIPVRTLERTGVKRGAASRLVHHLPVIGPTATRDMVTKRLPAWDFLALLERTAG